LGNIWLFSKVMFYSLFLTLITTLEMSKFY
jgi:hypothetical protein